MLGSGCVQNVYLKPPFHYAVLATIYQFLQVGQDRVKWSRYEPLIFKSTWWENIQLPTAQSARRHEVVHVGSESGSAMPCPCYSGVPDLNTLISLCLRCYYVLPACLTINFDREDSRRSEKCTLRPRSHNAVFTMPPIANDPCTLSPIYPDLLDRDRSGPRSA